ncbi:MAG: hypothetical protein ABJA33_03635 [Pedococcus sp.]
MSTAPVPVIIRHQGEVRTLHPLAGALTLCLVAVAFSAGLVGVTSTGTSPLPVSGQNVATSPSPARTTGDSSAPSPSGTAGGSSGSATTTGRLPSPRPLSSPRR